MINAKEYKPVVTELLDLMNQQKNIAMNLLTTARKFENDEEFLWAIRNYLDAIDAQIEAFVKVMRMTQTAFENDEFHQLKKGR